MSWHFHVVVVEKSRRQAKWLIHHLVSVELSFLSAISSPALLSIREDLGVVASAIILLTADGVKEVRIDLLTDRLVAQRFCWHRSRLAKLAVVTHKACQTMHPAPEELFPLMTLVTARYLLGILIVFPN